MRDAPIQKFDTAHAQQFLSAVFPAGLVAGTGDVVTLVTQRTRTAAPIAP